MPPNDPPPNRGAAWILLSRFGFLLGSFGLYFLVARVLGQALFADYKAVTAWVSVAATVVRQGATQTVSRFVAQCPHAAATTQQRALLVMVCVGVFVGLLTLIVSALAEDRLQLPLAVAAGLCLAYAVSAVWHGRLNGSLRFRAQGQLDLGFIGLKLALVAGLAFAFQSATAAVSGFLIAAILQALWGARAVRQLSPTDGEDPAAAPSTIEILRSLGLTVAFAFALQCVVQLDLWWLQSFGVFASEATRDAARAAYGAFQLFCQVPYSLVAAIVFLMYPRVARPLAAQTVEERAALLRRALAGTMLFAGLVLGGVQVAPEASLNLLFPGEGAAILRAEPRRREAFGLLSVAYFGLCLLFVQGAALNAAGRARGAVLAAATAALAQLLLSAFWVPEGAVFGAAAATAVAHFWGAILSGVLLCRGLSVAFPWSSLLRVGFATFALLSLGGILPGGGLLMTVLRSVVAITMYAVFLLLLREPEVLALHRTLRARLTRGAAR